MSNDDPKMRLGPDHELCPSHVDVEGKPFAFCTNRLGHVGPCSYFLGSERADTVIAQLKKEVAALEKPGQLRSLPLTRTNESFLARIPRMRDDLCGELNEAITNDHIRAVELAYSVHGCKSECEADFRDALERIRADVAEASPHEVAALIDSVLLRHPPHGAESPAQTGECSAKPSACGMCVAVADAVWEACVETADGSDPVSRRVAEDLRSLDRRAIVAKVSDDRWPTVTVFAEAMRAKLEQHRAEKGGREGWRDDDPMGLANRVAEELRELRSALILMRPDPRRVLEEAADVANMAMMVADAAGALEVPAAEADAELTSRPSVRAD